MPLSGDLHIHGVLSVPQVQQLGEEVIANALLQLKHFEIGEMLANILAILNKYHIHLLVVAGALLCLP